MTHAHPGSRTPDELYATPPPWDIGRPQPAFRSLTIRGRVLDAGCGTGEHTLLAASLGLEATGIDLARTALDQAERKARDRGLAARFVHQDARHLAELGEVFDTVLDCGLFHIFTGADRSSYVDGLRAVLAPGGRYSMLGFSDAEPDPWPHKLCRDDITAAFAAGWRIESIEPAVIEARTGRGHVKAWLAALTRL
ncbi:class I SAM-dependent methyltransferase [Amycolatopsis alkalitolerans]|uniref:Class I SAM-dependent methyltransferase n=1 Tax=Amycolatopsis alkalitolerans TaxID=2547244 RepID=A0A5C4LU23_9PSEU|nr:class I SAM-dependent methyltransferase [Amycolatopsis alkalitolerans]TNC21550.1 class I SAM-dependent methyltransferase [Amycolatopsis alkalitolerans]